MKLPGRSGIEDALALVGERLAHAGAPVTIVIVGGAAMNLLGFVDRPTIDVDVLAGVLVDRRDLVFFKLYASADQVGPESVHVRDLLALQPSVAELEEAARWVCAQDPSPDFHAVVAKVVSYVHDALR